MCRAKSCLKNLMVVFFFRVGRVMEVAAILAAILGDWADFGLILGLLLFNASLGSLEN
jgi:H+-transporting ATPase